MSDQLAVLLGADSLLGPRSGVGRMTLEIALQLRRHPQLAGFGLLMQGRVEPPEWLDRLDQEEAPPLGPPPGLARLKRLAAATVPGVHRAWMLKQAVLLRRAVRQQTALLRATTPLPLVYHEPNMITRPFAGPIVATFNDLSWHHDPALHPKERLRWIARHLPRTIRTASRFIAISAFTRDEMVRELGVAADRIDVVHLAPSPQFRPVDEATAQPVLARYDVRDGGYVLSISTLEPRKNFDRLLAAYLALPDAIRQRTPLLIAGGKGWGTVLARPDAERAVAAGQLRLLGHVPDQDLITLTARCGAFVYVSLYEGFGLPVIEAMATGVPVIASSTTATGETAGNAALRVDPHDVQAITDGLDHLLTDPDAAAAHRSASLQRAEAFTWRQTVDCMAGTWRRAAS